MRTVKISSTPFKYAENAVPSVREALKELSGGGELIFEKGVYHFYESGTFESFFSPSNNGAGMKKVVFPIIGFSNVTIDGNDSVFIFHGKTFPFIIQNSVNITVKNILITTWLPPYALLKITEKHDDCFICEADNEKNIFSTNKNGNLIFKTESGEISTADCKLSLHSAERMLIRYLFAGDTEAQKKELAAPYVNCDTSIISKNKNRSYIKFQYRNDQNAEKCVYDIGESVVINLEEARERDVFFLDESENINISKITVNRYGGMGVIAQLCRNIEIDALKATPVKDLVFASEAPITLTADILHFVNCSGKVSIHDCNLSSSLDDACNIHGIYSVVTEVGTDYIDVEYKHPQQCFLNVYKKGDRLTVINNKTLDIIGNITVISCRFTDNEGLRQRIICGKIPVETQDGFFIESAARMPDIHIYNNKCRNIPHWRLSGAGKIVVENNEFDGCNVPVYAFDLAEFWYESGRINELVISNNLFRNTAYPNGSIITGVSGFEHNEMPKIHGSITVKENTFIGIKQSPYDICAFKNVTVQNNIYDGQSK